MACTLALLAASIAGSTAAAEEKALLRLRAFAIDLNSGARTDTLDIVIERWSTPEEIEKLQAVFIESGADKLLSALQDVKPRCGYVRRSMKLGWDIYYAREIPMEGGGRRIVLATDRPVSAWEARHSGRSMDYQFSLAEIHLDADGKGTGKAIPAAKLELDRDSRTLQIENWQREPIRLNDVTVVD
jgi:hypothetical protein